MFLGVLLCTSVKQFSMENTYEETFVRSYDSRHKMLNLTLARCEYASFCFFIVQN